MYFPILVLHGWGKRPAIQPQPNCSEVPKIAAANSLHIILFSQITSLVTTLVTGTVREFTFFTLAVMVAGGILGGIVGRSINKRIDNRAVEKLFIGLMAIIIGISLWNTCRYLFIGA